MIDLLALIGAFTVGRWLYRTYKLLFESRDGNSGRYGHVFDEG